MSGRTPSRRIPASLIVASVVIALYTVAGAVASLVPGLQGAGRTLAVGVSAGCLAGAAAWFAGPRLVTPPPPLLPPPPVVATEAETQRLLQRLQFDRQLHRALDDAGDEAAVHQVTARALEQLQPAAPGELLLLGGRGRLTQVSEAGPDGEGPGCPVAEVGGCPALRQGRTLRFGSRDDLDACAHLVERDGRPGAAVCVPLRILGEPAGVLHRVTAEGRQPTELEVSYAEGLAAAVASRLTLLRAADASAGAGTAGGSGGSGPATGTGRPAVPERVVDLDGVLRTLADLSRALRNFSVAQVGIDGYDRYTERNGTTDAEAALDVLTEAAAASVRPDDVIGLTNDATLYLVFPETGRDAASRALGRLREQVAVACQQRGLQPFGVTAVVVASGYAQHVDALFEQLDAAASVARSRRHQHLGAAGAADETT